MSHKTHCDGSTQFSSSNFDIQISQGKVATYLWWHQNFLDGYIRYFL